MNGFRVGDFDHAQVPRLLRPFCPISALEDLWAVPLEGLRARGKKLILLDVDNTLVAWRSEDVQLEVFEWVRQAREVGFELCILSNTRHPERLARLSEKLGIPTERGRFKPSRAMYLAALRRFGVQASEAVMIGDQIFTDVLGANRSGVEAIWVRQLSHREFHGTKVSRFFERRLRGLLYKALSAPIDEMPSPPAVEQHKPLEDRVIVHQIVKFLIVGGSSFLIDAGLRMLLLFGFDRTPNGWVQNFGTWLQGEWPRIFAHGEAWEAALPFVAGFSALVAMLNSFVWNRSWTFRIQGKAQRTEQLRRFMIVAWVGWFLNVKITTWCVYLLPGGGEDVKTMIATMIAAAVVAVWNFTGQRMYAFRARS